LKTLPKTLKRTVVVESVYLGRLKFTWIRSGKRLHVNCNWKVPVFPGRRPLR